MRWRVYAFIMRKMVLKNKVFIFIKLTDGKLYVICGFVLILFR